VLWGGLALLLLAGSFWVATRLGLAERLAGPNCTPLLAEISILEKGKAYERIVDLVAEHHQQQLSTACQRQLTERQVRAWVAWADQEQGQARVSRLEQALQAATTIGHQDLRARITTLLQNIDQEQRLAAQQGERATLKERLAAQLQAQLPGSLLPIRAIPGGVVVQLPASGIRFESGKATLADGAVHVLERVAAILNQEEYTHYRVRVEGHTDATGSVADNDRLAAARAQRVMQALAQAGLSQARLQWVGHGARRPIASNETEAGRQANRRVELIIEPEAEGRKLLEKWSGGHTG
jgi:flagellar motor protein MotB